MTYLIHPDQTGRSYFFTARLTDTAPERLTDHIELLRAAVRRTRNERPFQIDAWVTLPDHLHCIWKLPPGDVDHAGRWAVIMARFTRALAQPARQAHPVWHPQVWEHQIAGPQEHKHLMRYCWMNPVRHGLVTQPGDWLYSSWHRDRLNNIIDACGLATSARASQAVPLDAAPA